MKRFMLYGHSGSYNHGSEAIVKTTIAAIREKYPDSEIILSSHFPEQDREFGVCADRIIAPNGIAWQKEKKADPNGKHELAKGMYAAAISEITRATTLISIGGDNFCYNNWHRLLVFQEKAKEIGAKSILWGCSIEPDLINTEMADCLNTYDIIITRESETYNALVQNDINAELLIYPDIAFALEPKPLEFQFQGKFVGINLSPLILKYENTPGIILKNVSRLIDCIFEKTEYKILLIPHVINPVDNDCAVLEEIYLEFYEKYKGRIFLADKNLCAAEYKYLISKCEFVFCSRTHASIAAYSTNVPCVVIGYSVKARGIAKDLGMKNFLIDGKDIDKETVILEKYVKVMEECDNIKNILATNKNTSVKEMYKCQI